MAQHDSLDLIYTDRMIPQLNKPVTRSAAKKSKKEELQQEITELALESEFDPTGQEEEDIMSSRPIKNNVRFNI